MTLEELVHLIPGAQITDTGGGNLCVRFTRDGHWYLIIPDPDTDEGTLLTWEDGETQRDWITVPPYAVLGAHLEAARNAPII